MRFEDRFTQRAKNVLEQARLSASELGHSYVGSEHILLGIAREGGGVAAKIMRESGMDSRLILDLIEKNVGRGDQGVMPPQGLTPRAKRILEIAIGEANRLGHSYIGTEHLLIALVKEQDSIAVRMLLALNVDMQKLHDDIMQMLGEGGTVQGIFPLHSKKPQQRINHNTPFLDKYSRDFTQLARENKFDPIIGRVKETERVIQILSRRTKNNPCLVGDPGVGKTAIAEGLAQRIVSGDVPETVKNKRVVALDLSAMVAGSKYRGEFEERIKRVVGEAKSSNNVILFIDELHTLIGAGAAEGALDASNILKPSLARGEMQVIGATTLDEYRKHIEKDAALERRFQPVMVDEPSEEESIEILKGIKKYYEDFHRVKISNDVISETVVMSERYIHDRFLPDKAIAPVVL